MARFNAERYGRLRGPARPASTAAQPEEDPRPTPLFAKLMIRHTTAAGVPITIIQQPWMNEPRTYLTSETEP